MGDVAEIKELVAKQSREAVQAQKRVDDLIAELARQRMAPAAPVIAPDAAAAAAAVVAAAGERHALRALKH